jgi:hypothetical protein
MTLKRPSAKTIIELLLNDKLFRAAILGFILADGGPRILAKFSGSEIPAPASAAGLEARIEKCEAVDRRMKRQLQRMESKLDRVLGIPPQDYAFLDDEEP